MKRAQSTIIGSLITIVITIIFGVAVFSWASFYMGNLSSGFTEFYRTGQAAVETRIGVEEAYASSPTQVTVWVGNYGALSASIVSISISNSTYGMTVSVSNAKVPPGSVKAISVSIHSPGLSKGLYTVTVYASDGAYTTGYLEVS